MIISYFELPILPANLKSTQEENPPSKLREKHKQMTLSGSGSSILNQTTDSGAHE